MLSTWLAIVVAGVIYNTGCWLLGFGFDAEELFDAGFWAGAALAIHWFTKGEA